MWLFFYLYGCSIALQYDAVKEERYLQEAKQKELQRIEEALQQVSHQGKILNQFILSILE